MDFSMITPRLATGAAIQDPSDVEDLVAAGITAIIDCIEDGSDGPLLSGIKGMAYLYNGVEDDGEPKPVSWFAASLTFALPVLAQPHERVYAHCQSGMNRGPSTAYCLMRAMGFGGTDAINLIHAARPSTCDGIRYAGDADAAITALGFD